MIRRVVIAGAGSGVGKTTIATGIMSLLSKGNEIQGFKVGPDFIDPMFHKEATGRQSRNLDSFFMDAPTIRNLFGWGSRGADISIIEGVRGLYEGITSTGEQGSTAEIAKLLGAPVILVINARSLTKSAAAQVLGYKMLDPLVNIQGVILNQVSGERHREKAVKAVTQLTGTRVIGTVERTKRRIPERHLGLVTAGEDEDIKGTMDMLEEMLVDIDIDMIKEIMDDCEEVEFNEECPFPEGDGDATVAVPMDRAFSFYYRENLESMEAAGARIVRFSPVDGESLPETDSYYLGGGYPEVYASEISDNHDFLDGLRNASEDGKLIYGECGGMLALSRSIKTRDGEYPMAGIFDIDAEMTDARQGLAYVIAQGTPKNMLFPGVEVRGHEFHYTRLVPIPRTEFAYEMIRGRGIDGEHDGMTIRKTVGTYMHHHALANKEWGMAWIRASHESV
jgi:cobyrinic acid a,c-diamide synthase